MVAPWLFDDGFHGITPQTESTTHDIWSILMRAERGADQNDAATVAA